MGDKINKEFEKFQIELKNIDKRIKYITTFETNENLDEVINDLKNKEIIL